MLIIGHRGSSYDSGENTAGGIVSAIRAGVDGIEIDIRRSDDQLILLHDSTVTRTTNGYGLHKSYSFSSLRNLVCKNGERIPTLDEVMPLLFNTRYIFLEIKELDALEIIRPLLKKIPDEIQKNIFISSFDEQIIESFQQCKKVNRALVTAIKSNDLMSRCKELNCSHIHVSLKIVDQKIIDDAHKNHLKVFVFTINEFFELDLCLKIGVDGVFTDVPSEMFDALNKLQSKVN
ncbi:MAG: glycerophosphodiester phosphodiesterase family protein [Pseudomonadota bacterium]|nr:glycerophosphodiester phosphodiesterase family protein [Pseudomonadota bacterium]